MQSPPASCHFLPPTSKYSPQPPVLKHPQSMILPSSDRPSFIPVQNDKQNDGFIYFNVYGFRKKTVRQKTEQNGKQAFPEFKLLLIYSWIQYLCVTVVSK
jgi:hypothetical protein